MYNEYSYTFVGIRSVERNKFSAASRSLGLFCKGIPGSL